MGQQGMPCSRGEEKETVVLADTASSKHGALSLMLALLLSVFFQKPPQN